MRTSAPKLITHEDFTAPLNYAYHLDAVKLARYSAQARNRPRSDPRRRHGRAVNLAEDGLDRVVATREHGELEADLYIDCTGFRAQLIGAAFGMPSRSCREHTVLRYRAGGSGPLRPARLANSLVHHLDRAGSGLDLGHRARDARRGIGYVYSSAHTDLDAALKKSC